MYAHVIDGVVVQVLPAVPDNFGNVSGFYLLSDSERIPYGIYPFVEVIPTPSITQKIGRFVDDVSAARVVRTYSLVNKSNEDKQKELDGAVAQAVSKIESEYQSANTAPIDFQGLTFQADSESVALMAQVASALPSGLGITWYDSSNVGHYLSNVEFAELRGSILVRGQPLFAKKQTLKAAIRAAATVAEVEAVVW